MRATLPVTATAVMLSLVGCTHSTGSTAPGVTTSATSASTAGQPVPSSWPAPTDASAAVQAAGLPMLGREELAVHHHAHLDVMVNGRSVPVPADIGIDEVRQLISPLHTHDDTGVIHIESAREMPFTLGQFFAEWGQPLRATQVGPVAITAGQELRVYRNGQQVPGDPAALRLAAHNEIVVWAGPADQHPQVPASYDFAPGL